MMKIDLYFAVNGDNILAVLSEKGTRRPAKRLNQGKGRCVVILQRKKKKKKP